MRLRTQINYYIWIIANKIVTQYYVTPKQNIYVIYYHVTSSLKITHLVLPCNFYTDFSIVCINTINNNVTLHIKCSSPDAKISLSQQSEIFHRGCLKQGVRYLTSMHIFCWSSYSRPVSACIPYSRPVSAYKPIVCLYQPVYPIVGLYQPINL